MAGIKRWMLKAGVQKAISFLPYSHQLNFQFQRYVTHGVDLSDQYLSDKLQHARDHVRLCRQFNHGTLPEASFELGTGWYPIVPLYLFLCGVRHPTTIDISRHCKHAFVGLAIQRLLEAVQDDPDVIQANKEKLQALLLQAGTFTDAASMLESIGIRYLVGDARNTRLAAESFGLVHSNNTFEHIYPEILRDILIEARRIGEKGAVHSHFIDMSDHFAHMDTSINIYHFLQYSPEQWKRIDNTIQPQNRWRLSDYLQLFKSTGYLVKTTENRPGDIAALGTIPLHKNYMRYTKEDLAISHAHVVAVSE
jgi:hypothetical protein